MKKIKNFANFLVRLGHESTKNDLFALSGNLTYKLILAIFPLIIFSLSIIGFLNLGDSVDMMVESITSALPEQIVNIFSNFVFEVVDIKSTTLLSASLVVAIYSASSGFDSIMLGINKTYGRRDTRNWLHRRALSIALVLIFVMIVLLSLGMMIFSRNIRDFIFDHIRETPLLDFLFGMTGYVVAVIIILVMIVLIYKIGCCKKVTVTDVFPGACVTVIFWILFSKVFNVYVNNFSRYSMVYGSIGSIFVLLIWLNFITSFLLIGSEINAMLAGDEQDKSKEE